MTSVPALCLDTEKLNDYDPLAHVFDRVMGIDFHRATHDIRKRVVQGLTSNRTLRVLDLCSGTGIFFLLLAANFKFEGFGIDLSREQVRVATENMRSERKIFRYRVGDITTEPYPADLDLVTINFDSLNHIRSRSAWQNIFQRASGSLNARGALLFDINLPERLLNDWNHPEVIVKDDLTYIQLAHAATRFEGGVLRQTPMIVFEKLSNGFHRKLQTTIEQFSLPVEVIVSLLRSSGLREVEVIAKVGAVSEGHLFNRNRAYLLARK